jgi:hypothetical protein
MESLGFSVQAEPAHRNQMKAPNFSCWVKGNVSITHSAGVYPYLMVNGFKHISETKTSYLKRRIELDDKMALLLCLNQRTQSIRARCNRIDKF